MSGIVRIFEPYLSALRTGFFAAKIQPCLASTLDLARGVAAALILVFHVRINVLAELDRTAGTSSLLVKSLYLLTSLGPPAVMWFFVVSGFLVTSRKATAS
jgi:peptidoglycan/LPS O-acetylase OafA/YrhL